MPDNSVDAVITSPPYNYNLRIQNGKYTRQSWSFLNNKIMVIFIIYPDGKTYPAREMLEAFERGQRYIYYDK